MSVAAIRKIELGQSNPSLLTILSLVEALGESIDRLVSDARSGDVRINLTRGREAGAGDDRTGDLTEPALQCSVVTLKKGEALGGAAEGEAGGGPAFGYLLDGAVSVAEEKGEAHGCRPGDAFHLSSLARFQAKSTGEKTARLILVKNSAGARAEQEGISEHND